MSIDKNSEKWRRFCEVKHVLRMDEYDQDVYLQGIKEKRSEAGYWLLKDDIKKVQNKIDKNG